MKEELTLEFSGDAQNTFRLLRTTLEERDEEGVLLRRQQLKTRDESGGGLFLPESESALVVALVFVRAAQWQLTRLIDAEPDQVPILLDRGGSRVAARFIHLRADATKELTVRSHGSLWLKEMVSLPGDPEERHRLSDWFAISQKRREVGIRPGVFPRVVVLLGGQAVSERQLDGLETHLSLTLGAGLPPHLERDGLKIAGKMPSIQPGWFGQEEEAAMATAAYLGGEYPILEVLGPSTVGKTVFATYWLRRLIGNGQLRQRHLFAWSFSRQGVAAYVQMPLTSFFRELAELLDVGFGPVSSPVDQANAIIAALDTRPTLFFLDGIEATFRLPEHREAKAGGSEIPVGLTQLLRGIVSCPGSFVLATSREDVAAAFGLPDGAAYALVLKPVPVARIQGELSEYTSALAAENAVGEQPQTPCDLPRSTAEKDHRRILMRLSGCASDAALDAWIEERGLGIAPPGGYALPLAAPSFSAPEMRLLNIFLSEMRGRLEEVLFCVLAACHRPISDEGLLWVASQLSLQEFFGIERSPKEPDWRLSLERLLATGALEQAASQGEYSVHPGKRRFVAEGLKKNKPAAWMAINRWLAEERLRGQPWLPETREELIPLLDAGIYLCEAGQKRRAYQEIGFTRLCRGLKGHAIFHMGEYDTPRGLTQALLGDESDAAVSDLPPEAPAMCLQSSALCLRYLDRLEEAFQEQRRTWARAKATKKAMCILPAGFNMLRLCHIFGELHESREVQLRIVITAGLDKSFRLSGKLEKQDVVDGASVLSSTMALAQLYRGWKTLARATLGLGEKECRDNAASFRFLMLGFGRPWHALALLEIGAWRACEQAIEAGEWGGEMARYRQTGIYEVLAAKTFLEKARVSNGKNRATALARANEEVSRAMAKSVGVYRWWAALSTLTQGEILAADGQHDRARETINTAHDLSVKSSFKLLIVDSLVARAKLAQATGNRADAKEDARRAAALAKNIGYHLRDRALTELRA